MGYYTVLSGKMSIVPPIPWSILKDSDYTDVALWELGIHIEEKQIETDEGTLYKKEGYAVSFQEGEEGKFYDIEMELQNLVDAFADHEHRFVGCIEGVGEEQGDQWKLFVRENKVIRQVAEIAWPDPPPAD